MTPVSFSEECQAVSWVNCDEVSTAGLWLSLSLIKTKFLKKLLRRKHLWHYMLCPLFLERWRVGNQPAPRVGPACAEDKAFGLGALTEAKANLLPFWQQSL